MSSAPSRSLRATLLRWGRALESLLYPLTAGCPLCGRELPLEPAGFCANCLQGMRPVLDPCPRCGRPAKPGCCVEPYELEGAAHAVLYEETARRAVIRLKYNGGRYLAEPMGRLMAARFPEAWRADALVPVPLHPKRRRQRGYNQSEQLADRLSEHIGIPVRPELLQRLRDTPSQAKLARGERLRNLAQAFRASDAARGLDLILIDDVYTTGATVDACARALRKAGARSVRAMCFAIREEHAGHTADTP